MERILVNIGGEVVGLTKDELIDKAAKVMSPVIFEGLDKYANAPLSASYIYYLGQSSQLRIYARRMVEAGWRP
jgi:hypothetical protein